MDQFQARRYASAEKRLEETFLRSSGGREGGELFGASKERAIEELADLHISNLAAWHAQDLQLSFNFIRPRVQWVWETSLCGRLLCEYLFHGREQPPQGLKLWG